MIRVGDQFPDFEVAATISAQHENAFTRLTKDSYDGQWKVYFFWPKDFTFVCPTEIKAFDDLYDDFQDRDAMLIGGSIDSEFVHLAWRQAKAELHDLRLPMLADIKRELANALGILDQAEGVMQRATLIVDPDHIVRFVMVNDLQVGRNPQEVLRVLDALQTDELCPCNWQPGEATIQVNAAQDSEPQVDTAAMKNTTKAVEVTA